jgi:hypothetical protein
MDKAFIINIYSFMWYYNNEQFNPDDLSSWAGFVYLITDLSNGKMYVGKKTFWSTRKLPPLKGQKRKRIKKSHSDWQSYYGSSEEVKLLVEESGTDRFKREILRLCTSKGEMSYFEAKEQFDRDVLFRDDYYNAFIGCKIHANHVKNAKEEYNEIK